VPLPLDEFDISCFGGIRMADGGVSCVNNQGNIGQHLDGLHHFDDVDANEIQNIINRNMVQAAQSGVPLPRDVMVDMVIDRGLKHPLPNRWNK
jgi:hypothetical protein